jgi:methylphosphotriester-DNA--protein-cysteine methyltransferase
MYARACVAPGVPATRGPIATSCRTSASARVPWTRYVCVEGCAEQAAAIAAAVRPPARTRPSEVAMVTRGLPMVTDSGRAADQDLLPAGT